MLVASRTARGVVVGVLSTASLAAALSLGPSAQAAPANCTAGDYAQIAAGVSAGTSVYLFTHPEVNDFFTSLEGVDRDTARAEIEEYFEANPQVAAEIGGIRQPMVDLRNRCGDLDGDGLADY